MKEETNQKIEFIQIIESKNNLFVNNENEYQLNPFKYLNNND